MSSSQASTNTTAQAAQIDIAEDGDVILVINTGSKQMRLRVFSQCLRAASKVFNIMFGDNWREGKSLSTKEPAEIALPEDDPEVMLYICRTLHFQPTEDDGPNTGLKEPAEILRIAVQVDKYDLTHVFTAQISKMLSYSTPKTVGSCIQLFCAMRIIGSQQLDLPWLFDIVAKHVGSYSRFMGEESLGRFLDYSDLYRFEETRNILRLELTDMLNHYYDGQNRENCDCEYEEDMRFVFRALRKEYTAISLLQKPAAETIQKIQEALTETVANNGNSAAWALPAEICKCLSLMQSRILSLETQAKEKLLARDCSGGSSA